MRPFNASLLICSFIIHHSFSLIKAVCLSVSKPNSCKIQEVVESLNLLADFTVEFVDIFDVDPRYLKPVLVALRPTTLVCHLRPVDAHFQVNFGSVAVHGVDKSFVERLWNDRNSLGAALTLRIYQRKSRTFPPLLPFPSLFPFPSLLPSFPLPSSWK